MINNDTLFRLPMARKKLILWFLFFNVLYAPSMQADSSSSMTWEHYIPVLSLSLVTGLYVHSLLSPNKDLKNQSQCRYWTQDFVDTTKIYYPQEKNTTYFFLIDDLQVIANETERPVLVIAESHIKHDPDKVDLLFEQARLLAPCIMYIEKDMSVFTAWPFDRFNEFVDDSQGYYRSSCTRLMDQIQRLRENYEDITMLGIGCNYDRQSMYDICNLSFNIKYEKPSYKERCEFLHLLFLHRSYTNVDLDKLAKKTIGFSYHELIKLVKKSEQYAVAHQIQNICNIDIDKAFEEIIDNHDVYKYISDESFYATCVHEMGHACMVAHFHEDFILYNAISTPQSWVDDPKDIISLGLTWYNGYQEVGDEINEMKRRIMVNLSGKIAEQIFFGLSGYDILNSQNGYREFILNPGGADHDLQKAKSVAQQIQKMNQEDPYDLLQELYGKALKILFSYKDILEKGAKILEQNECILGSQVYKLLESV